ncbi:unnamed protein product [Choristocarpus tenellus]
MFRKECLGVYKHPDCVTSVVFHPRDDRIMMTGCFDKYLRLWNVQQKRVLNWTQCPDIITTTNFSPDGQLAVGGLFDGRVIFYHTQDLKYYTQVLNITRLANPTV